MANCGKKSGNKNFPSKSLIIFYIYLFFMRYLFHGSTGAFGMIWPLSSTLFCLKTLMQEKFIKPYIQPSGGCE